MKYGKQFISQDTFPVNLN